ncbi:MAG: DUF4198 domain-containing protein [Pseudomonadota bacterium]
MRFLTLLAAAATLASPALGHEFWISPEAYKVATEEPVRANIRVGESFKGNASSFFSRSTEQFFVLLGGDRVEPEATLGDRPVLNRAMPDEGLAVVVYETTDSRLTYRDWQKFVNFVEHKDFDGALERHAARGLPEEGFVETYRRYAKSLIAVGNGDGADAEVGLDTEIIALANPYTDDLSGGFPVRVTLYGAPRADAQVETYARAPDGTVTVALTRTDADGVSVIEVKRGYDYMVDAVVLEERKETAAWHSMWANLTFAVPTQ